MGNRRKIIVALALAAVLGASAAHAQGRVKLGLAGTGLFSLEEGGGSSFGGMALLGFGPRHGLNVRLDATVVHGDDVTSLLGTGDLLYIFDTPRAVFHPYLLAGGGVVHASDETEPLAKFGGGIEYHIARRNRGPVLFAEPTLNLVFAGDDAGGTSTSIQLNLGLKLGG